MPKTAYFDCLSGISGDMTLAALIDLGVDPAAITAVTRSMGLPQVSVEAAECKKHGFRAIGVTITHPPEHAHRHLDQISEMIDRAETTPRAKATARDIFHCLAEAEAKVHGTTIEKVHFHEVGAIDSIADIVGTAVAMDALNIELLIASPVPTGTGSITIAHGRVSVPAPATAELLRGIPIAPSEIDAELTTPTGAAILRACADSFGSLPAMTIDAVGYGAGSRDLDEQANVLRILLGETPATEQLDTDRVVVLETNIDDATAEQLADCAEQLFQAGAVDVFQTPCVMKKGRAGTMLSVLAKPAQAWELEQIVFQHTTTIGIRRYIADRHKLVREAVVIDTEFGKVRGKVVSLPDGTRRLGLEADDVRAIAVRHSGTANDVRNAAEAAWQTRST